MELGIGLLLPYRGHGLGKALVQKAQQWTRDRGRPGIVLSVHAGNQHARDLFRQCGFRPTGSERGDWLKMDWWPRLPGG